MTTETIHYALVGDGRLARHFRAYLAMLGLPCSAWARNPESPFNTHTDSDASIRLDRTLAPATHVLLLVSDDAIAPLLRRYPQLHGKTLVHCAGALSLPGVAGAHPLMTFGRETYTQARYEAIPFMVESGYDFADLLPGLPNPHHAVGAADKARYHALCVVAGNFPQILWRAVSDRFEQDLGLPREALDPYLEQSLANFLADPQGALTGPLARDDRHTVQRNLAALQGDALKPVYEAFEQLFLASRAAAPLKERAS